MIVNRIAYDKHFIRQLRLLPEEIKKAAVKKENLFRQNPLHPSLRLHALHGQLAGHWSISLNSRYRIIFTRENGGVIFFISIGKHDIYQFL